MTFDKTQLVVLAAGAGCGYTSLVLTPAEDAQIHSAQAVREDFGQLMISVRRNQDVCLQAEMRVLNYASTSNP